MNLEKEALALNEYFNKLVTEYKKLIRQNSLYQNDGYSKEKCDDLYLKVQEFKAKYKMFIKERKNSFGKFNVPRYIDFYSSSIKNENKAQNQEETWYNKVGKLNANQIDEITENQVVHSPYFNYLREPRLEKHFYRDQNKFFGVRENFQGGKHEFKVFKNTRIPFDSQKLASVDDYFINKRYGFNQMGNNKPSEIQEDCKFKYKSLNEEAGFTGENNLKIRDFGFSYKDNITFQKDIIEKNKIKLKIINDTKIQEFYKKNDYRRYLPFFFKHYELRKPLDKDINIFKLFGIESSYLDNLNLDQSQYNDIVLKLNNFLNRTIYISCLIASFKEDKLLTSKEVALCLKIENKIDIPGFFFKSYTQRTPKDIKSIKDKIFQNNFKNQRI